MNDTTTTYAISALTGLFGSAPLARDGDVHIRLDDTVKLDALARSGDCFVTIASKLDAMCRDIEEYEVRQQLENIVSDLLYLQDNYKVTKKEN